MKRVTESGDVELSNNLIEQMMRSIKMKRTVEDYLMSLLDILKLSREGDDLTDLLPYNLATLRRKSIIYTFMQTLESSDHQR